MPLRTRTTSVSSPALSGIKADLRSMSEFHAPARVKTGSTTTLVESRAAAQGIKVKQRNYPYVPKNRILLGIGLRYARTFATAINPLLRVASLAYDVWKLRQEMENNIVHKDEFSAGAGWYLERDCGHPPEFPTHHGFTGFGSICGTVTLSQASLDNYLGVGEATAYWYLNFYSNVRPSGSLYQAERSQHWRIEKTVSPTEPEASTLPQQRKMVGVVTPQFTDVADYYSHWIPSAFPETQPITGNSPNKRPIPYKLRPYFRYMNPAAPFTHGHYELQPSLSPYVPNSGLPYVADPVEVVFNPSPEPLLDPKGFPAYHNRQKAPARQMERKVQIKTAMGVAVYRVASDVGEAIDIVDELYAALPNRLKARYPNTPYVFNNPPTATKIKALYDARNYVSDDFVARAIENLLVMKIEDSVYGKLGQLNAAASEKVFRWSGRGFQTGGWVRRKF